MNLNWLKKEDVQAINALLSNGDNSNVIDNFYWNDSQIINQGNLESIFSNYFSEINNNSEKKKKVILSNDDERKIFFIFLKYLPDIERHSENNCMLRKYSDANICLWNTFTIGRFDVDNLNDLNETKWFSSVMDGLGRNDITKIVKHVAKLKTTFATYTTLSETNVHYMTSNYSPENRQWVEYNKHQVFRQFDDKFLGSKAIGIRGFVRYGANKHDLIDIYEKLRSFFPYAKSLDFALILICFFVKGVCMKAEEEYRFLVLNHRYQTDRISINVEPKKFWRGHKNEILIWNHFYPSTNLTSNTACGCMPQTWNYTTEKAPKLCDNQFEEI